MPAKFSAERHQEIRQLVRRHRRMNFEQLHRIVGVSPATLRRDLTQLEKSGGLIRVHGGVLDPAYARTEVSFDERVLRHGPAKSAIAHAAAAMIPPGAHVFIDAGSTCLEAGRALLPRKDVRIITHSVALLEAGLRGEAEVLAIGGSLRKVSGALTGPAALQVLDLLRAGWALIAASGLHPTEGCSTTELSEAEIKRAAIARAGHTVLLADASKWNHASTVRFAAWSDFDAWITDRAPTRVATRALRAAGVKIHAAAR